MAKKVELEVDVKGSDKVQGLGAEIRSLTKELRNTPEGTKKWSEIYNKIDDLKDKMAAAKISSKDFVDTLEDAGGPLGTLGAGLNKIKVATQSWGTALKATGIGLIVSLIGGLVAAFSETEGSMKKLQPLLIGMEKIFGGLVQMAQPFLDTILDLGMKALPFVTEAFKNVYSAVGAVFSSLGKLGSAVVKLIKGDFSGAWDDAKSSVTEFGKNFETNQINFEKGAAKMTKTQKENLEKQKELNQKAYDKAIGLLQSKDKMEEASLDKAKAIALQYAFTEEQRLAVEQAFADKAYQIKKNELEEKQKLLIKYGKKNTDEYKDNQAEMTKLDADRITQVDTNAKAIQKIHEDYAKQVQDFEIKIQQDAAARAEEKKQKDIDNAMLGLQNKLDFEKLSAQERIDLITQQEDELLKKTDLTENERTRIHKQAAQQRKQVAQDEKDALLSAQLELASGIGNVLGQMSELFGKNTAASKVAALAEVAINTAVGYVQGLDIAQKSAKATGPAAAFAFPIFYATQVAAVLGAASKAKSILEAGGGGGTTAAAAPAGNSTAVLGKNYGNGGMINGPLHAAGGIMVNAEGGEAIMTRGAVTQFAPLLSLMNQAGGGVSFSGAATGQAKNDQPLPSNGNNQPIIKTYVVSSELTSHAEKQAKLKDLSTL